jgi:hypothetical protein
MPITRTSGITFIHTFASDYFLAGFLPNLVQPLLRKAIFDALSNFLRIRSPLEKAIPTRDLLSTVITCADFVTPVLLLIATINDAVDTDMQLSTQM